MNKDNQIMSLLSEIDEDFIDDILVIPQKPISNINNNEIAKASGKGLFLKFAAPIAACLAVAGAALGVLAALNRNGVAPVVSEEVTTTAEITLPEEVSEEDLEDCKRYFESNVPNYSELKLTPHVLDLDFDGSHEIMYFPKNTMMSNIYVFFKENGSYGRCEEINTIGSDYPLYDFDDLKLYDKNGEKYYYYYYYNTSHEEKGIAAFYTGLEVSSLFSYGCYSQDNPYMNENNKRYYKIGDSFVSEADLLMFWEEYEDVPDVYIPEYWDFGKITIENTPHLSDLAENLPYIQEGDIVRPDHFYENTAEKVIISQMNCGKYYKATVLGYNVITYEKEGKRYVSCHKAELVLTDSSGKILGVQWAHSPYIRTEGAGWDLLLSAAESCMDVVDFGDNQVIMLRDAVNICEKTLLYGVKEGALCVCERTDISENERSVYCPYLSGAYFIEGADTESATLVDRVSKLKIFFDFQFENKVFYIVNDIDILPQYSGEIVDIGDYEHVEYREIPYIDVTDLEFKEKARHIIENSLPKVLFAQETVIAGDSVYNLYLIGENVRRSIEGFHSDEYINCNNVRTAIFKDGIYLGSVTVTYNFHNAYFPIGADYDDYIAKGYYCQEYDALLIVKSDPAAFSDYAQQCFAAVKNGELYPNLTGSWADIVRNPKPEGLENSDEIEIRGNELSCGDYVYRFNFDESGFGMGQYDFEVCWRGEKE